MFEGLTWLAVHRQQAVRSEGGGPSQARPASLTRTSLPEPSSGCIPQYEELSEGLVSSAQAPSTELNVEERARLGRIHLQRVAMADEVLIVNVGDHVGESTRREIEHARSRGVAVRYVEPHTPDRRADD